MYEVHKVVNKSHILKRIISCGILRAYRWTTIKQERSAGVTHSNSLPLARDLAQPTAPTCTECALLFIILLHIQTVRRRASCSQRRRLSVSLNNH